MKKEIRIKIARFILKLLNIKPFNLLPPIQIDYIEDRYKLIDVKVQHIYHDYEEKFYKDIIMGKLCEEILKNDFIIIEDISNQNDIYNPLIDLGEHKVEATLHIAIKKETI